MAWELFEKQHDDQLDLDFHHNIAMETRFGGVYKTKSNILPSSKYFNQHFSSRISSLLNQYKIKLSDFRSKQSLKNHLQTIDFSNSLKLL